MIDYTIEHLADRPEQISSLARLLNAEWGHLEPWQDVAELQRALTERSQSQAAPFTLVALSGDRLLGSASIKFRELAHYPDRLWWIGDVIVAPDQRARGIGGELANEAVRHAQASGIFELFLYTPDKEEFYARRGWETVGRDSANGENNIVMRIALN
ncbi:N-acetylglutamate synthase-like GNAT family acetyltransferase [Mycoplana sp. BE70]|uniref:GNAT family N-acetyltransferase n=1 Tax=Mycoplana sp. BE70 TaxID=2817775 RepID=UPI00285EEA9D|nr:GNAT family N-acetyltransferase [Mycoplana sp. BE70]MDR6759326.1 N-acetylglutamate synthase-like GNAT family acetyltransferase [Mycoplana sp. BE70]